MMWSTLPKIVAVYATVAFAVENYDEQGFYVRGLLEDNQPVRRAPRRCRFQPRRTTAWTALGAFMLLGAPYLGAGPPKVEITGALPKPGASYSTSSSTTEGKGLMWEGKYDLQQEDEDEDAMDTSFRAQLTEPLDAVIKLDRAEMQALGEFYDHFVGEQHDGIGKEEDYFPPETDLATTSVSTSDEDGVINLRAMPATTSRLSFVPSLFGIPPSLTIRPSSTSTTKICPPTSVFTPGCPTRMLSTRPNTRETFTKALRGKSPPPKQSLFGSMVSNCCAAYRNWRERQSLRKCDGKECARFLPTFSTAKVYDVYDGDTIRVIARLNKASKFFLWRVRIARIDAPEMKGGSEKEKKMAIESRDALRELLLTKNVGGFVYVTNHEQEKWGRLLCELFVWVNGKKINVSDWMIENGYAVQYDGGKKIDWDNAGEVQKVKSSPKKPAKRKAKSKAGGKRSKSRGSTSTDEGTSTKDVVLV